MITSCLLEALNDRALLSQFGDLLRQDREGNALHLSGIHRLKAHLTRENHEQVLAAARHKTIRQIEELVAGLAPQPDVPSTLRALPMRSTAALTPAPARPAPTAAPAAPASPAPTAAPAASACLPLPVPRRSPDPAPLSPGRYRLQVTLGENARNKLKQLQDLLAHQVPNGDPAAIVERAFDALLTQVYKRKAGITDTPRPRKPKSRASATATTRQTRYIRVAVRREVWSRDEGRCGFVGEGGHRCNETHGLQFAHRYPWGKGGADTTINLGLRCQAHNAWEADRDYGASHMASKRARGPLKVRELVARYSVQRGPRATDRAVSVRRTASQLLPMTLSCLRGPRFTRTPRHTARAGNGALERRVVVSEGSSLSAPGRPLLQATGRGASGGEAGAGTASSGGRKVS